MSDFAVHDSAVHQVEGVKLPPELAQQISRMVQDLHRKDNYQPLPMLDHTAAKGPDVSLSLPGGDHLSFGAAGERLDTADGNHLTVKNGGWDMTDANGKKVEELPQLTRELRMPPWYDLSNGGRVTYDNGQTTITMPGGKEVVFDKGGISAIKQDSTVERLR